MKLYEIDEAILRCVDTESGEIIDPVKLDELNLARAEKVENVALWIKDLKAEAEAIKAEKLALAERQKVAENKVDSLKRWLVYALEGQKFSTPRCAVSFRRADKVEVTEEGLSNLLREHDDLLTYREPEPNKTAIKKALNDGLNIQGVHLVQTMSAIIK